MRFNKKYRVAAIVLICVFVVGSALLIKDIIDIKHPIDKTIQNESVSAAVPHEDRSASSLRHEQKEIKKDIESKVEKLDLHNSLSTAPQSNIVSQQESKVNTNTTEPQNNQNENELEEQEDSKEQEEFEEQKETHEEQTPTPQEITNSGRDYPLYEVYKNGYSLYVPIDLQWYIRDLCNSYGFIEEYVYGMIILESSFEPSASNGSYYGLCQISPFWIGDAAIDHFTSDYYNRDLLNPYDNLLTMAEMWCYARDEYSLNLSTYDGMMRVLYWHNTGSDPSYISSSSYFNTCVAYANELVALQ